jgi:hypothetical protein
LQPEEHEGVRFSMKCHALPGPSERVYERRTAELCGTKRAFPVALWPSPKGGADYKVVEVPPGTEP